MARTKKVGRKAAVSKKTSTKKAVVAKPVVKKAAPTKKAVVAKPTVKKAAPPKKAAAKAPSKSKVAPVEVETSLPKNYSDMTVVDLKALLVKRNLSTTGLKKVLITRLEYWDEVSEIKPKITNKGEDTLEYSIIISVGTENDEEFRVTLGHIRDLLDEFKWEDKADIKKISEYRYRSDWEIIWPGISKDIAEDRATELDGAPFLHYVVDSAEVKIKPKVKWSMIPTAAEGLKRKPSEKSIVEKRTGTEKLVADLYDIRTIYSADYIIIGSWSLLEAADKYAEETRGAYVHLSISDIKEIMKIAGLDLAFVDTESDDDPEIKKTEKQISKLIKNPAEHEHVKKAFRTIAESKKLEIRDFRSQVVAFHNDYSRIRGVLEIMEYIAQKRTGWLSRGNPTSIHTFAVEKEINEDLEDYVPGASLNHNVIFFGYND